MTRSWPIAGWSYWGRVPLAKPFWPGISQTMTSSSWSRWYPWSRWMVSTKSSKKIDLKGRWFIANPVIQGWWWEVKVVYCILVTFTYLAVAFCFICTSNNTDSWKQVQVEKMDAKVAWSCFTFLALLHAKPVGSTYQVYSLAIDLFFQPLWLKLQETPTNWLLDTPSGWAVWL